MIQWPWTYIYVLTNAFFFILPGRLQVFTVVAERSCSFPSFFFTIQPLANDHRDYCVIFKPFTMALNILQGEQNACIGYSLPVLSKLKTNVSLAGEESLTCKPQAKALIEGIDKRFSDDFKNPDHVLAAVLSPTFKFDWIREEKDKDLQALKHLERELKSIVSIEKNRRKIRGQFEQTRH